MLMNKTLIQIAVAAVLVGVLGGGSYAAGYAKARQAWQADAAAKQALHTASLLAAEQAYTEKLQQAAAEKQRWYEFAQMQSGKLAEANRRLDFQAAKMEKDINHAIKQDNKNRADAAYNGIGPDSLRLYNRAFGYPD